MSTNYYVQLFEDPGTKLHIGKSSAGWKFSLRVHPDRDINTFYDWLKVLSRVSSVITDEYGRVVQFGDMVRTIAVRGSNLRTSSLAIAAESPNCSWVYCDYEFC